MSFALAKMPLIAQIFPPRDVTGVLESTKDTGSQKIETPLKEESQHFQGFEDFQFNRDDEYLDSDLEGSIIKRPRQTKPARTPTLPPRSDKRGSMILDSLVKELEKIGQDEDFSDPHELYLSSEEDASESADDYDGALYSSADEDESQPTSPRTSIRKSQEITARVVSIKFAGKPQVVEIHVQPARQSPAPEEKKSSATTTSQKHLTIIPPYCHLPKSRSSSSPVNSTANLQGPTATSNKASDITSVTQSCQPISTSNLPPFAPSFAPSFLVSDPFPATSPESDSKLGKSNFMQRTLHAAKKRPSIQKLNLAYTAGVVMQRRLSLNTLYDDSKTHERIPTLEELRQEEKASIEEEEGEENMKHEKARVAFQAPPVASTPPKHRGASMLSNLTRRKSTKGRGEAK